jgi:Tfp pilus assembly protein PilX
MKKNSGNMLAVFLGILLLTVIILPLVIQLLQTESKQSVNHQKSTVAFQLAEMAVAKAVVKLTESRQNWDNAVAGVPLAGYNDDKEYSDVNGGTYKVKIAPSNTSGMVRLTAKGKDSASREVRVIETEYSGTDTADPALLYEKGNQSISVPSLAVHWGSIKSFNNVDHPATAPFPRIFSAGRAGQRDIDPAPPNTNNVDYWSFQTDMGSPPVPDLGYYKEKAKNSIVPAASPTGDIVRNDGLPVVRNPVNSGYFQSLLNPGKTIIIDKRGLLPEGLGNHYEFRSSTSVLYFELAAASLQIKRAFLDVEAVIFTGPIFSFLISNSTVPYLLFGATIPVSAPLEYQGTTGAPTAQTVWASTFSAVYAQANHCCYTITNPQIHGFVYMPIAPGNPGQPSSVTILGAVQISGASGSGWWVGNSAIYYDPAVLKTVKWSKSPIYRTSWKETRLPW